jgi:tetratricopeptide (TPR) repeat protein
MPENLHREPKRRPRAFFDRLGGGDRLNSSYDITLQHGLDILDRGEFSKALTIFRGLEREGYETPDLLEGLGRVHMSMGAATDAIVYFRKAIKGNPNLLTSRINLGLALVDQGEVTEGLAMLKCALEGAKAHGRLTPKSRAKLVKEHVRLAETYCELGFSMEAVQEYERAIRIGGDYPDLRRKIAGEYIRMNLLADAERELKKALHRNPFYEEARADLGFLYLLKGRPDLAGVEWSQVPAEGRGSGLVSAYRRAKGESEDIPDARSVDAGHGRKGEGQPTEDLPQGGQSLK